MNVQIKKITSILLLIPTIVLVIFLFRNNITSTKAEEANLITQSNYQTWEVSDLSEGESIVKQFLASQKTSSDNRPFKDNTIWTEGSLMALEQIGTSVSNIDKNSSQLSKDLIREQLIMTVQKMELKSKDPYAGEQIALNNYPNDELNYNLNFKTKTGAETISYDMIFVLDWSNSMASSVQRGVNARSHQKQTIQEIAKKILASKSNSRIRLIGTNAQKTNDPEGSLNVQVDTGFVNVNNDYQRIIDETFKVSPKHSHDNMAFSVKYAYEQMERDMRQGVTPYIMVASDFQLYIPGLKSDARGRYVQFVNDYYNSPVIRSKTQKAPIYQIVNYQTGDNPSSPMIEETIIPRKSEGWDSVYFKKSGTKTSQQMADEITNMVDVSTSTAWTWEQEFSSGLEYVDRSFSGSQGVSGIKRDKKGFTLKGSVQEAESNYAVTGKTGDFSSYKKGELIKVFDTSQFTDENISPIPNVFAPVSDIGIDLYVYNGTGDKTNIANYSLDKSIASDNYTAFNGINYTDRDPRLSKYKYGTKFGLDTAKLIIQDVVGKPNYDKLIFDTEMANQPDLTVKFDSSKNVYNVFAERVGGTISVKYEDSEGKELAPKKELPGRIGSPYKESPIDIPDYVYYKTEGQAEGSFDEKDKEVKFLYVKQNSAAIIKQTVLNEAKNSVDGGSARQNSFLTYNLELKIGNEIQSTFDTYNNLSFTQVIDGNLGVPQDITLKESGGKVVGEATYDESTRTITATLKDQTIKLSQGLALQYKAQILGSTNVGTEIKESGLSKNLSVSGKSGVISIPDLTSNEVVTIVEAGHLEFISAPDVIDFGQELKLSAKDQVYSAKEKKGQELIVQDYRSVNDKWSMSVNLAKDITSVDGEDILPESLMYQTGNNLVNINTSEQVIHVQTTINKNPIDLSSDWSDKKGLQLHVKSGLAKAKQYKGSLQWTLRDVP